MGGKKLQFEIGALKHRWPVFAVGMMHGREFLLVLWLVEFRLKWGY